MTPEELTHKISIALLIYNGDVGKTHNALSELIDETSLSDSVKNELKSFFSIKLIEEVKALLYTIEKQKAFNAITVVNQFMGDHPLRNII